MPLLPNQRRRVPAGSVEKDTFIATVLLPVRQTSNAHHSQA